MRILVTGSRNWTNYSAIEHAILREIGRIPFDQVTIVEGGGRGADAWAALVAERHGLRHERHNANWNLYGKQAGMIRNQEMVKAGADVCLAFPLPDSRGTIHCMERARVAGIRVVNHGRAPEPRQ